jgi:hypothetical protein
MRHVLVVPTALLILAVSSPSQQQSSSGFEVSTSDGTARPSPPPPQFNLNSVPVEARRQLLPLYQQEYSLLQELSGVRWQALSDTLGGLASIGAHVTASPTAPANIVEESAARAGQYDARYPGVNAALDAQEPAEMYASVKRAMQLLLQIDQIDKQISRVQQAYGIGAASRPPWASLFPASNQLTPAEVYKLLAPAAKQAAGEADPGAAALERAVQDIALAQKEQEAFVACTNACPWDSTGVGPACVARCTAACRSCH